MSRSTALLLGTAILAAAVAPSPATAQEAEIAFESDLPRTLVFIAEEGEGEVASRELTNVLRQAGFPVIDPALAHTAAQRELVQEALAGDEGAATNLGRDFGAQILLGPTGAPAPTRWTRPSSRPPRRWPCGPSASTGARW